jgi:beta-lactamase class D
MWKIFVLSGALLEAGCSLSSRAGALAAPPATVVGGPTDSQEVRACFLLYEFGVGEVRRAPDSACTTRVSPQSTFKIPHALAALDAGVVAGPNTLLPYDGSPMPFVSWQRHHTLASAIANSVVWYFERIALMLGPTREREYLRKFDYGNADSGSHLTSFWRGDSLLITPEEQARFLTRLYHNDLPADRAAMKAVREMLVQPQGTVVNAAGVHSFGGTWPPGTVVSAKTGSGDDRSGRQVRWLIGHIARGSRAWIFVTCVTGPDSLPAEAAIELAARSLHDAQVL